MKRLLIPLAAACLSAAALAVPATAAPSWATDNLLPKPADAYGAADFWLDSNGAALRKATQYNLDVKNVSKLVSAGSNGAPDGKPGMTGPTTTAKATVSKNVNLPKTVGKVFFLDKSGNYRWCSATSIQSRNRNLVATAGHCVFANGKDDVYDKWIFVPGYYQGKAPWGVYVGAYAFTAYDLDTYDDYDGDFAFVAVHNGFTLAARKEVTRNEFLKWGGDKWVEHEEIKKDEFDLNFAKYGPLGPYWSKDFDLTPEKVGHDYTGAKTLTKVEVTKAAYEAAPKDTADRRNGEQYEKVERTPISLETYKKLAAEKSDGKFLGWLEVDKNENGTEIAWYESHYYLKQWVKTGKTIRYFRDHYILGIAKDMGRLGDVVGGQGVAWNQPLGQPVTVFGYPSAPHPDGDRPFSGVTPKWCSGKTATKSYQVNTFKVETHQLLKCSMTGGADGGPWLMKYDNNKRTGYVNGVTSLFHDNDGNGRVDYISSAIFDGEVADVYNKANYAETKKIVGPNGELLQ
ncbi:trypsin-like serine peptidase [Nonomuraea sp. NPDC050451]|uniref:trypsin-like serine peptidase n=1 Tax=Nonomuraea sp. NPDC050451 TaxID=3364364 RepID=UPI0037BDA696